MTRSVWVWGLMLLGGLPACDDGASPPTAPPAAATALRLVFPGAGDAAVCNGRLLACARLDGACTVDLDSAAEGWGDRVVLCQVATEAPLFAPTIPVVFKDGLPIWTPNLDAAGRVVADARSTALATAFLSPYLTATWPETARALLAQTNSSPYMDDLVRAVGAKDQAAVAAALPTVVADVGAQTALEQPLSDSSRNFDMEDIVVERTSGYVTLDSRLGTPVDHVCVLYALEECGVESESALANVSPSDSFPKTKIDRVFVAAKSVFNLQVLAKTALRQLFGDIIPGPDLETLRLEPGRVHDIQCYSGALGLLDEADARADAILISAEPEGRHFVNFARVANLISVALDTLRLFVDFDAFEDSGDIAKSVAICAEQALGPALELTDGTTREEWFDLLKVVQTCAIKRLGVVLAKRGMHAVAVWVFDFAVGGGGGWVGKVSRAGMILDRIVGMTLTSSPVQRQLLANAVDFEACAPCEHACDADDCTADGQRLRCLDTAECRAFSDPVACPAGTGCAAGECIDCGGVGEVCCGDTCDPGNSCLAGECVAGCRDECPANAAVRCAHRGAVQTCGEHDGDPCLEWGTLDNCPDGQVCEEGICGEPRCENDCEADALRCNPNGDGTEICGNCDPDGCLDWCPDVACAQDFECRDAACACVEETDDLPGAAPGLALPQLLDDGSAHVRRNSLWPERDVDILSAYIRDTPGDTIQPMIQVTDVAPGITYDLCIAFACDPEVNAGQANSVDCFDGLRTTRDGRPACCLLGQQADATAEISVGCTIGGLGNDSGTATAYIEAVRGEQCAPALTLTLIGGID